jgi:hypothetical protein
MGMLEDLIAGAIGYGIASSQKSKVVADVIDNTFRHLTLEELVDNYAKRHLDVYGYDNKLANRLHNIARKYEDYDYDRYYGNNNY